MSSEDPTGARLLSDAEIKEHGLDPAGTYLGVFVINDKLNRAVDPSPFKIAKSFLAKMASTVVGRPFIAEPPDGTKHVRGSDKVEGILNYQKQFATGEFVKTFISGASGNAYGIVRVFDELAKDIKQKVQQKKILPYTSPLVAMRKFNENGEVIDGEILHVQAVQTGGYGEEAKIIGMCDGMLSKCMQELRIMGAAGTLGEYRKNHFKEKPDKVPDNEILRLNMPDMTKEEIMALIKTGVNEALKEAKIGGAAGVAALQTPEGAAHEGAPGAQPDKNASATPTAAASATEQNKDKTAAGFDITKDPQYIAQANKVKELEQWKANTEAEAAKQKRLGHARTIAKAEAIRKEIALDKVEERVKELFDMKGDDSKPMDLSFAASREEKVLERIAGASGSATARLPNQSGNQRVEVGFDLEREMMP